MKKIAVLAFVMVLFSGVVFAQSAYDKDTVVAVMRANGGLIGQIGSAAGKNDFQGAAEKLMLMAQGMNKLLPMTPPKGDKAEWDKTVRQFVDAAYKGIGACGTRDSAALNAAVNELRALNKAGHAAFK